MRDENERLVKEYREWSRLLQMPDGKWRRGGIETECFGNRAAGTGEDDRCPLSLFMISHLFLR